MFSRLQVDNVVNGGLKIVAFFGQEFKRHARITGTIGQGLVKSHQHQLEAAHQKLEHFWLVIAQCQIDLIEKY